ncbi:MAG: toxin ParE1/3/4 [Pseudomonadota bacterium]|nr:toxin ParE1/3/4 [Pseudomonadota bacterium]MDQ5941238.1 toxin ParE1/3/4 [Pseudomonadota bacterium]
MQILWTDEALDDFEEILAWYHHEAGPRAAIAVQRRIVLDLEALASFPERIRASERLPGARELVVNKLPYIVFVQIVGDALVVLNVVHTRRKFPA